MKRYAGVAQLAERDPSKFDVVSSNLIARSKFRKGMRIASDLLYGAVETA